LVGISKFGSYKVEGLCEVESRKAKGEKAEKAETLKWLRVER
jgi:hypothetical protein